MKDEKQILSIGEINQLVKELMDNTPVLQNIWIKGEISNLTNHASGHMYFSLKDSGGVLRAVMFKWKNQKLRFKPKNGMKVMARGGLTLYPKSGSFQINLEEMQEDGVGNLHLAFEELKKKLETEGLFAEEVKKPLPKHPVSIGVITSPTGAAIKDILTTLKRRYPIAKITFMPVLVQGESAPASIKNAIEKLNEQNQVDVLIVGRGGGSIEDLWGFNDESVARAIFSSNIPIISAVGHETDFTIADFVADLRAPTPTAAAELATPMTLLDLERHVESLKMTLAKALLNKTERKKGKLENIQKLLAYYHPKKQLEIKSQQLDELTNDLLMSVKRLRERKENKLQMVMAKLDALSPLKTLSRGFSIVEKEQVAIKSAEQLNIGDELKVTFSNGQVKAEVKEIKKRGGES